MAPFQTLIITLLIVLCWGCKQDVCPHEVPGENFLISAETASLITPYQGHSKVYFTDTLGNEIEFLISEIVNEIVSYSHTQDCVANPEIKQRVKGEREYYEFSLRSEAFERPLNIRLLEVSPAINGRENNEALEIIYGHPSDGVSQADVLLYHTPLIELWTSVIIDELALNDKTYREVIISSNTAVSPKFDLYYTATEGIIFIQNKETNYRLYYDRIE